MSVYEVPWLEVAISVALAGSVWVSLLRQPVRAFLSGLVFTGATLACAVLAWLVYEPGFPPGAQPQGPPVLPGVLGWLLNELGFPPDGEVYSVQPLLFGRKLFAIDDLSAPLIPLVALLHFLTALATGRTKMRHFSLTWSLAAVALRLAIFSCTEPWLLVGLLAAETVPPYIELLNRGKSARVYLLHMALFVALLAVGWAGYRTQKVWATVPLLAAVLIRCGTIPAHCWVTDWFEHASFGNGLLFVTPLVGVYAAVRLVLPTAPDWVLRSIGWFSLATAVYAAGMALVQQECRRFFAYLFLSHSSLVLVGLEMHTPLTLTGALALWISVSLSLAGFGLTFRALEARYGRQSLAEFHGLYEQSPILAMCFALTALASVSFPGTLGFVAADLLVDGAVGASPYVGLVVVLAMALNGIAVVRVYFRLFTGARHASTVSLKVGPRERVAVLTLAALLLGGGLYPKPGIVSRYQAADKILQERANRGRPSEVYRVKAVDRSCLPLPGSAAPLCGPDPPQPRE